MIAIEFVDGLDYVVGRSDLEILKSSDYFYRKVIANEFVLGGLDGVVGSDMEILKSSDRVF